MSPVETWCRNLDYYIPDEDGITNNLDAEQMTRIRKFKIVKFVFLVFFKLDIPDTLNFQI